MKIISKHPLSNACAVVTEDGRASILNITYGAPVPGARIEGNGTLQHPLRVVIEPAFTPQESATLVAALRMYQDRETDDSPGDDYADIARSAGEPLDVYSGIDSLCEKARAMSGASPRGDMVPALVAALRGLSSYVGGHDEKPDHPARIASDTLARWDEDGPLNAGPFVAAVHRLIEAADESADMLRGCPDEDDAEACAQELDEARATVAAFMAGNASSLAARCHALADELLGANMPADLAADLLRMGLHRVGDYLESEDAPTLADALRALIASADKSGGRLRTVSRVDVDRARATLAAHDKAWGLK